MCSQRLAAQLQSSLEHLPIMPVEDDDHVKAPQFVSLEPPLGPRTTKANSNNNKDVLSSSTTLQSSEFERFCIALQTIEHERIQERVDLQVCDYTLLQFTSYYYTYLFLY